MGLEDRIGPLLVVAIAVVEGEAGEAAAEIALGQPAVHLVERDDVDSLAAQPFDRVQQERRRDLEALVGRERALPRRPHVVEHEDRADPSEEAAQHGVKPAEIEGVETGADDRRFHRDLFELRTEPAGCRRRRTAERRRVYHGRPAR